MFFFGGLQSIFVEQKLQNVRVKVPCRHMLNFFMFNELYGFRALQKEPCCQFAEKKIVLPTACVIWDFHGTPLSKHSTECNQLLEA